MLGLDKLNHYLSSRGGVLYFHVFNLPINKHILGTYKVLSASKVCFGRPCSLTGEKSTLHIKKCITNIVISHVLATSYCPYLHLGQWKHRPPNILGRNDYIAVNILWLWVSSNHSLIFSSLTPCFMLFVWYSMSFTVPFHRWSLFLKDELLWIQCSTCLYA